MAEELTSDVTQILAALENGDPEASERLYPAVREELRALAGHFFASRGVGHTMQPTILVDDVFMKLARKTDVSWEGRAHFFAVAAKAMRDLLIDHARAKRAQKRGGDWQRITLTGLGTDDDTERQLDILDLEEALGELGRIDARQERIVELRFFAGLSVAEVAGVLGVSERTVMYDWRMARAWLRSRLEDATP